ncbi:MAG: spore germination protein [Clostridia bacterium]|nr:spore germination protein [Clostridia bacterium]
MNDYGALTVSENFSENIKLFKDIFINDAMLRIRTVYVGDSKTKIAFLFFDGMVESSSIEDSLIRSCVMAKNVPKSPDMSYVLDNVLYSCEITKTSKVSDILTAMLNGDTAVILENSRDVLTVDTKGWRTRGIDEPSGEMVMQGPREGFDEAGILSVAMIRRKLQTPDLCVETLKLGRRSKTQIFICYLGEIADKKVLSLLKSRLKKIDIDGILDSNYIAEFIRDGKNSIFETLGTTERPDIVAARLLEGRIALIVDGTPVVLTMPYLFSENFQSDEDYYVNFLVGCIGRGLRYLCFFISTSVPAIFIALSTYHIGLLPTPFMLSVAELRSGVPFSSITECLLLIIVFEILRETGLRTPENLGSALSIVGGLVVGQAAVDARIISAPMLIVVALSGVAGLMIPRLKAAVFYLKIAFTVAAALMGLMGYLIVACLLLYSILSQKSMGVDYTVSLNKISFQSLKDTVVRGAWPKMKTRPSFNKNSIRSRENNEK